MRKTLFSFIGIALIIGLATTRCGKPDEGGEGVSEGTSFLSALRVLFPECNSNRTGYLAYATDESQFYTCSGTAWVAVSISGSPGEDGAEGQDGDDGEDGADAVSVYDAFGERLGSVVFAEWPAIGIRFASGSAAGVGMFLASGVYDNGLCKEGKCSPTIIRPSSNLVFATASTAEFTRSYCVFNSSNCSGTCHVFGTPITHSLFRKGSSSFVRASGSEFATPLAVNSTFLYDKASCTTLATGSGVCCSNIGFSTATAVGISDSYSFPSDGPSYPFTGPLFFE